MSHTELTPDVAARLISSVRVSASTSKLTARETEILRSLAKGISSKVISDQLSISEKTVNNHIANILTKLEAHTRLEAIRRAESAGLI